MDTIGIKVLGAEAEINEGVFGVRVGRTSIFWNENVIKFQIIINDAQIVKLFQLV